MIRLLVAAAVVAALTAAAVEWATTGKAPRKAATPAPASRHGTTTRPAAAGSSVTPSPKAKPTRKPRPASKPKPRAASKPTQASKAPPAPKAVPVEEIKRIQKLKVKPTQKLVVLYRVHEAFSQPSRHSKPLRSVRALRPITGERTTLPVIGHKGHTWFHVRLPGRPNGLTGWIMSWGTATTSTTWHIVVDTGARRLAVYNDGRRVRVFPAVVGKPASPTPRGTFFVEESVQLGRHGVGGPLALALSARSDVYRWFDGGPGQVAVHGLWNIGGVPGTAVSHGCIRLRAAAIRWLAHRVGPGVPVTVIR